MNEYSLAKVQLYINMTKIEHILKNAAHES